MQKYRDNITIQGRGGLAPVRNANVTVFNHGTTDLAVIYSDAQKMPQANPFQSDSLGGISFYAENGHYDLKVQGSGQELLISDILMEEVYEDVDTLNSQIVTVSAIANAAVPSADLQNSADTNLGASLVGYRGRNVQEKLREIISPEDFGAVGDGVADDTEAIRQFFSAGGNAIADSSNVYRVSGQITNGGEINIKGRLNLLFDGTLPSWQTGLLTNNGIFVAECLSISASLGRNLSRPITVGPEFRVGELYIDSPHQQGNYTGASNSAVYAIDSELIEIGYFYSKNFDRVMWLSGVKRCFIGFYEWHSCCRGLQTGDMDDSEKIGVKNLRIGGGVGHGDSPNSAETPGHNILCLATYEDVDIGTCYTFDTGEHGIRILGGGVLPSRGKRAHFAAQYIYRPGASGFKSSAGTTTVPTEYLSIEGLYVEDAGKAIDDLPPEEYVTKDNHYGLFLDGVLKCNIGWYKTRSKTNNYNGLASSKIRDCQDITISSYESSDTFLHGIRLQNTTRDLDYFRINSGSINSFGKGGFGGAALKFFNFTRNVRYLFVNVDATNGPNVVEWSGFSGTIPQPSVVSGYYGGITGDVFSPAATGNLRDRMKSVALLQSAYTTSGSPTLTDYPVGSIVSVFYGTGAAPNRNGSFTVYVSGSSPGQFVSAGSGETLGSALDGIWRSKGILGGNYCLMQRIS